jgi:hypothetical protein
MKNKILILIIGMFLLGGIIAGNVLYQTYSVDLSLSSEKAIPQEQITFDCDGEQIIAIGDEPDEKYDKNDIESLARRNGCSGTATNFVNSKGETYECVGGVCSFNETEKLIEYCSITNMDYSSELNKCVEKPVESPIEEPTGNETGEII